MPPHRVTPSTCEPTTCQQHTFNTNVQSLVSDKPRTQTSDNIEYYRIMSHNIGQTRTQTVWVKVHTYGNIRLDVEPGMPACMCETCWTSHAKGLLHRWGPTMVVNVVIYNLADPSAQPVTLYGCTANQPCPNMLAMLPIITPTHTNSCSHTLLQCHGLATCNAMALFTTTCKPEHLCNSGDLVIILSWWQPQSSWLLPVCTF